MGQAKVGTRLMVQVLPDLRSASIRRSTAIVPEDDSANPFTGQVGFPNTGFQQVDMTPESRKSPGDNSLPDGCLSGRSAFDLWR